MDEFFFLSTGSYIIASLPCVRNDPRRLMSGGRSMSDVNEMDGWYSRYI